ncbi:Peptide alpha-N-acetyltransferase protein [Dioscorea alata]|uniref:Peptide alpha-N-acetyltransferase protein n=1 Tax=Dioscorea alata TaxID=55571 RepID=A0ACB7VPE0_DIOAL|nr:Peptide alpha-N-acetyltransferase protein [Dioscorea alata]
MDLHHGLTEKVFIREFNEDRDLKMVEKLEMSCEIGSRRGFSILTNMMGDPLCRIRLYPLHVMLVAELAGNGEVVGVVRGCMKFVGTGLGTNNVRMGCILGLRVSPKHRRMGIATKLVKFIESWAIRNGAEYMSLATEENNIGSINLFVLKFDYMRLNSLWILIQPLDPHAKKIKQPSHNVKIEKLSVEQAISLYKNKIGGGKLFPGDIDAILKEKLSLGTWVSYYEDEQWSGLHCNKINEDDDDDDDHEFIHKTPNSWAILSIWKTYESYELQIRGAPIVRFFHSTLSHITSKVLPCLRVYPSSELLSKPFGFLFLYGLHGEGERVGELIKSLWFFAQSLAKNTKDCKVVVTELGACDPLREHVPLSSFTSRIDDLWFIKRVGGDAINGDIDIAHDAQAISSIFIDPRDF